MTTCITEPGRISVDGTRIVFRSKCDLTGDNPHGNFEIFLFDTATSALVQLTTSNCARDDAAINADGTRIVFASSCDLTGGNPHGRAEIFLYDTTTATFTQVTSTPSSCNNTFPVLSADGARIAFFSPCDLMSGTPTVMEESSSSTAPRAPSLRSSPTLAGAAVAGRQGSTRTGHGSPFFPPVI
jgi:Tol biopolymer transport system component